MTSTLQRLFYNLQFGISSVSTRDLTKSFGWSTNDAFIQHDIQELNRVLTDSLEQQMRDTPLHGSLGKLFCGTMQNSIKCLNVDYQSTMNEIYYGNVLI